MLLPEARYHSQAFNGVSRFHMSHLREKIRHPNFGLPDNFQQDIGSFCW
jgi:hypothetical protein